MSTQLARRRILGFALACALALPFGARAQDTGDLFGDVIHILRDSTTGQPILQKRWIELPGDTFGWGYCPVPVDAAGVEIPFAELSCDVDPTQLTRVVEVDYFGRLSASRTKERNQRMHFDEIIVNIKLAEVVDLDDSGRIRIGTGCDSNGVCATWKTIDSPMENMSIYNRLLKYGHIQTDPLEEDIDAHGSPEVGIVYHPALAAEDWAKFRGTTLTLLPRPSANQCFTGTAFVAECAAPQALLDTDFVMAATLLGGAADKHGKITPDLVQYINRFLKIPIATPTTLPPVSTLPALVRDENGVITPATPDLPFPASERFVDFGPASYLRTDWFDRSTLLLQTQDAGLTYQPTVVQLLQWLAHVNGPSPGVLTVMPGFIADATDALRVIEFIHEYEMPANLWGSGVATHTGPRGHTVRYRATNQNVPLTATVTSTAPINAGTVTFSVRTAGGVNVGVPVISGPVVNGLASATYELPGGTPPQTLAIIAVYNGTADFLPSSGSGSLAIGQADTAVTVDAATTPLGSTDRNVALTARLSWADTVPVSEGSVEFVVRDANGVTIGTAVAAPVSGGVATVDYLIPGSVPAQRLTTFAAFGGTDNFAASSATNILAVGCLAVTITPFAMPRGMVGEAFAFAMATDGIPPVTLSVSGTMPPGLSLNGLIISGTPTTNGSYTLTVTATDAVGCVGSQTYTLRIDPSLNVLAVGPGAGVPGVVRHFEPNGIQTAGGEYAPYTWSWTGGVRVARGDIDRDGVPDTFVAPGPGMDPIVRVYNGASQALFASLPVFEAGFLAGVNIAVGDITGDGVIDLVAAASTGVPRVRIFNGTNGALLYDFVAFSVPGMSGVQVATGDFNADGRADLLVGSGAGAEPYVKVFDAATGGVVHNFLAYPAEFRGGVFVAAGDLNADGRADIVTGPNTGGGPIVRAFNGVTGAQLREFWAYDTTFLGGVRVAAADVTGDGHAEIVTAPGPGGAPIVKVFHGATNAELWSFPVYPPEVIHGVYVAAPVGPATSSAAPSSPQP